MTGQAGKIGTWVEHQGKRATICIFLRSPRIFGMDCEMVRTSAGSALAHITLVQFQSSEEGTMTTTTVMDELVKPEKTIIDY